MAGQLLPVLLSISIVCFELRVVSTNFQAIGQTSDSSTWMPEQSESTTTSQSSQGYDGDVKDPSISNATDEQVVPLTESLTSSPLDTPTNLRAAFIVGLRIEESDKPVVYDEENVPIVPAGTLMTIRLFGDDVNEASQFRFVAEARERGADCDDLPFTVTVNSLKESLTGFSGRLFFRLPSLDHLSQARPVDDNESLPAFYICSLQVTDDRPQWIHQGKEPGVKLRTYRPTLPLWFQIVIIAVLLSLSGLFSGLNLGLMALDRTELKIYMNTGSEREKSFARAIIPVRNHGNYLLCTLLLGNVLVNSTLTILLDELTSGIVAVIGSTIGIVILGEIVPQAICSRHGLAVGAHTVWITKFFMLVTFPMSYPISLLLNAVLGEEIGAYYNRERLKELIKVTKEYHDLEKDEINIISGALEMRRKTVGDIMTHLEDIFMLSYDSLLDFETVSEILKQGFSRVPIYDGERTNIVGLLFIKELALVDPEDAIPLKTLCKFYQKQCHFVFDDTTLDVVFRDFKDGNKGHMAFVQRVNIKGQCDPFYETVGLVTLEDVIEELIQAEIVDETDVWIDNRSKRRRDKNKLIQDFSSFANVYRTQSSPKISAQLSLSAFQFLSSSVDAFHSRWISESVLRRLVQQGPVIHCLRLKNKDKSDCDPDPLIYQQGKLADYFVLILEGRVEVTVGKECLVFEAGPFSHYGSHALNIMPSGDVRSSFNDVNSPSHQAEGSLKTRPTSPTFISDYTVRALTDVTYLRVNRFLYQAARSATLLEREKSAVEIPVTDLQSNFHHEPLGQSSQSQISLVDSRDCGKQQPREHCQQTQSAIEGELIDHPEVVDITESNESPD